jgi:phospholipid/cholesterol/gamma-HCH transport system substrate-binding protein
VTFIRPFAPSSSGGSATSARAPSNYDANGHYARIQPIFNAFSFTSNPAGGVRPAPAERPLHLQPERPAEALPGAASQPPEDKSAPFLDDGRLVGDCNPAQVPPGP